MKVFQYQLKYLAELENRRKESSRSANWLIIDLLLDMKKITSRQHDLLMHEGFIFYPGGPTIAQRWDKAYLRPNLSFGETIAISFTDHESR